jgi:O-antigen/teichoic acid export membrane protein
MFKYQANSKKLFRLFKIGLPMGASMMIYSAVVAIPRFFIEEYIGIAELGVYIALYYLYSAILLVAIAFADAALPRFTAYELADNQQAFWNLLRKYIYGTLVIICLGALVFWFFGSPLLKLAYGDMFKGYTKLFIVGLFVTGIEIMNKFLATCMTAKRILVLQPFLNFLSFVNLGAICFFMAKNMTLFSVLIAQGITFGIQMILTMLILINRKKKSAYSQANVAS